MNIFVLIIYANVCMFMYIHQPTVVLPILPIFVASTRAHTHTPVVRL